jgi:hypothetical protein
MVANDDVLWELIEARDRAFGRAHNAFASLTREAREKDQQIELLKAAPLEKDGEIVRLKAATIEKDEEIARLKAATTEKDEEIARLKSATDEKDAEIQVVTRAAAERLGVIREMQASPEYKAGLTLLHPWRFLRRRF